MRKFALGLCLLVAAGSVSAQQSLRDALGNYAATLQNNATDELCDSVKQFGGLAAQANQKGMSRFKVKDAVARAIAREPKLTPAQRPIVSRVALNVIDDIYANRITDESDGIAEARLNCVEQVQSGM
ncbi:hypothetical protein [Burkholderia territorii]|uniref:hypothetical protein n=1 Tax=Burkholderia territorii TaxID=1503055 RepID=UPI000754F876|nr:hypothetical protein [Burkholderia territorii]KWE40742.1 hypothetical protein WT49_06015 [Burkholderia territorii]KWE44007.1 hypothetical protein WT50_01360 [Burkholderia territorii]KWE45681.1 hypothetical protein WT51_19065 [Burkholderia territorii]